MTKYDMSIYCHLMGGVMVSVLALSSVDRVFNHRSRQTKNYEIIICYFSAFHTVIESKTG